VLEERRQRRPECGLTDGFPELSQALDAMPRLIAGDDGSIERTDRNTAQPVRHNARLVEALKDARLIGA
jgi:hypothetical protein